MNLRVSLTNEMIPIRSKWETDREDASTGTGCQGRGGQWAMQWRAAGLNFTSRLWGFRWFHRKLRTLTQIPMSKRLDSQKILCAGC
jgi:hypothetical protein